MQVCKKLLVSFLAALLIFSQSLFSLGDIAAYANEGDITLRVGIKDEFTTKSERITFDVWARTADDQKIDDDYVSVTSNGNEVDINWSDQVKTSYTVWLEEGPNKIYILVDYDGQQIEKYLDITYEYAEDGDVIGEFTFSMDGFVVGLDYFIEPMKVPIIKGENAAIHLERILAEEGFETTYTGSPESGYYLSSVLGGNLMSKPYPPEIPQAIHDAAEKHWAAEADPYSYDPENYGIGEFDFNYMSGWMYSVNNVFPNVGFSDYYLMEDDVMRVQFTVAYGSDIGGGYAMGGDEHSQYFERVNKDYLTDIAATINSSPFKTALYNLNPEVEKAYESALKTLSIVDVSQEKLDDAEKNVRAVYDATLPEAIITTIDSLPASPTAEDKSQIEMIRFELNQLSSQVLDKVTNLAEFEMIELLLNDPVKKDNMDKAAAVDELILQLPSPEEVQLSNQQQILEVAKALEALTPEQSVYIENKRYFEEVQAKINQLIKEENLRLAQPVIELINQLPDKEKVTLEDEEIIQSINEAYKKLSAEVQVEVKNYSRYESAFNQLDKLINEEVNNYLENILPLTENVTLQDKELIEQFRKQFETFRISIQNRISSSFTYRSFVEAEKKIVQLEAENKEQQSKLAVDAVITAIKQLPTLASAKLADEANYNKVKQAFDALTTEQQKDVTNAADLKAFEEKLSQLKKDNSEAIVKEVIELIKNLPDVSLVKLTNESTITTVEKTYNSLTKEQKALVTNSDKLNAVVSKLAQLKKEQQNEEAVKKATTAISALPAAAQITLANKLNVQYARSLYDALSTEQKALVTTLEKLIAAEFKIKELEVETTALISEINTLPTVVTEKHEAIIKSLREAYDALTSTQKAAITNISKLVEAEQKLKNLTTDETQKTPNIIADDFKEAVKDSEGIAAIEQNKQLNAVEIQADNNSTKAQVLSNTLINQIKATKVDTVILKNKHNIAVEIPINVFSNNIAKSAAFEVETQLVTTGFKPSVKVKFTEILSNGIKRDITVGHQYVKVKLPISLFNQTTAVVQTKKTDETGVILRKTADGYEAVPHRISDGEVTIFANENAEYVYTTDIVTFNDIAKLGNKDDIEFLASRYVVKGYSEESYEPNKSITRSQFAVMIARSLNLIAEGEAVHTDTKGKAYEEAVQALYEVGITNAKGQFNPSNSLTREQAASFMYRLLMYAKPELETTKQRVLYTDVNAINENHMPAVIALYEFGIMEGKADGSFDPKGKLTRAQMAKILRLTLNKAGMM